MKFIEVKFIAGLGIYIALQIVTAYGGELLSSLGYENGTVVVAINILTVVIIGCTYFIVKAIEKIKE